MKLTVAAVLLLAAFLVSACSGDDAGEETPPASTAAAEPTASATTPASGVPSVRLQRVFPNLSFRRMTGMYQTSDGAWWVTEQAGRVVRIDGQGQSAPVLDITDRVSTDGNEEGLLGLAFAPDFGSSRAFYVYYSASNPRRSIISRFVANAAGGTSSAPGSETKLLEIAQPFSNHNGGQIGFGPDGFLYVALGDGGSANDPMNNGQNLNTLLGKLLRIDVSGSSGYSVPQDNPFVGRQNTRPEIWAYGLRNPWRFSFDRQTGDIWAGDVGQGSREEIDVIVKGANYGWKIMEGTQCLSGDNCNRDGLQLPIIDYSSASGPECSVTGGFVYRGSRIGGLQGA
ncbi:MAG TPA: PQQ-dependent sugar dehydrogenase [Dehalococcoidia bacterium]|nr:PQQ-dependent sugar dehydrogenase [Dehalococcoidia bacterium]